MYKALHRKLKIEQHELKNKNGCEPMNIPIVRNYPVDANVAASLLLWNLHYKCLANNSISFNKLLSSPYSCWKFESLGALKWKSIFRNSSVDLDICIASPLTLLNLFLIDDFPWQNQCLEGTQWVLPCGSSCMNKYNGDLVDQYH